MLAKDLAIAERAEDILMRIVSKNARVYETERAAPGLPAVAVYLACEEYALRSAIAAPLLLNLVHFPRVGYKKVTQKQCQVESGLGNKLFRRTLEMCRAAKNLDESKINFVSLTKKFDGHDAIPFMTKIFAHFKDSCFEAGIVDKATWDANYILVLCAVFCWTCDRVAEVRIFFLSSRTRGILYMSSSRPSVRSLHIMGLMLRFTAALAGRTFRSRS